MTPTDDLPPIDPDDLVPADDDGTQDPPGADDDVQEGAEGE